MNMKSHLPEANLEKLALVLKIKQAYQDGALSLDEARAELKAKVGSLKPYEIALAEQELQPEDPDECRKENIQHVLDLFQDIMQVEYADDLEETHPISCYLRENNEMRKHLLSVEDLVQYPIIRNQWYELYDELAKWRIHLSRKQNQLYSVLEKKGFTRPTTTMWLLDDFVRDEISAARRLLEEGKEEEFIAMQATIVADVRDLMQKEETVLYPTSLAMIKPAEFDDMRSGDREIGFAFIPDPHASVIEDSPKTSALPADGGFGAELQGLLNKYGYNLGGANQKLNVTTGELTLEQINLIYQHLPIDISFVDENELVCFYSDTNHRIFPRSKNVIGRDVKNCHPRTSVHLVEEIIEKFRSGEQDTVDFWINKPGLFIYIYYVAVRDKDGRFRGVLEMMQDCTRIRELQDSRTLLKWSQDTEGASKHGAPSSSTHQAEPKMEATATTEESEATAGIEIEADTRLKDLLEAYPNLKSRLPEINPAFKMLSTPLGRIMIPKATVNTMAERSDMPLSDLIVALQKLIASL